MFVKVHDYFNTNNISTLGRISIYKLITVQIIREAAVRLENVHINQLLWRMMMVKNTKNITVFCHKPVFCYFMFVVF